MAQFISPATPCFFKLKTVGFKKLQSYNLCTFLKTFSLVAMVILDKNLIFYIFWISGNEGAIAENGSEVFTSFDKSIFQEAKNLRINRTVHAGEDGPSVNVKIAVEEMFAQRIGHGYRVMQDPELYRKCR